MLAVEVTLLTGRYVATKSNDRDQPEWPPHPARLFSALVAAYAEPEAPDREERLALEWFETLGAPSIRCTATPARRAVVTSYVPVNDTTVLRDQEALYEKIVSAEEAVKQLPMDAPPKIREKLLAKLSKVLVDATAGPQRATKAPASTALELLPDHRVRQPRTYPTMVLQEARVWYRWPDVEPMPVHTEVLDGLLARVARLGHSSSMVSCRVQTQLAGGPAIPGLDSGGVGEDEGDDRLATYVPDGTGTLPIRVTGAGLLSALEVEYQRHRGSEPRALPSVIVPYRRIRRGQGEGGQGADPPAPLLGGDWIVLRRSGSRIFTLRQSLQIARAVRLALISHASEPVHEMVSGHVPGAPGERTPATEAPHLAIVPLPNVGNPRADGRLLGVGLVLPRDASEEGRRAVLEALRAWREAGGKLVLGERGACRFEPADGVSAVRGLRPGRWCHPAEEWVSVTPVALDRHPGDLRSLRPDRRVRAEDAARQAIARACTYAGLPEPSEIEIRLDTPWLGVPPAGKFPPFRTETKRGARAEVLVRCCVHVRLRFAVPVRGPVLIGAGRYYGYGLFAPALGAGSPAAADDVKAAS